MRRYLNMLKISSTHLLPRRPEVRLAPPAKQAPVGHTPWRDRFELTTEQRRQDSVLAKLSHRKNADGTLGIAEGGHRPAIGQLNRRLAAAGFDPQEQSAVFTAGTQKALQRFQRSSQLPVTGRLDPATWKKLSHSIIDSSAQAAPRQQRFEHSSAVKRTEKLLAKAGFHTGAVDGFYSAKTQRAVRALEKTTGRHVDGALGEGDLAALKRLVSPFSKPPDDYRRLAFRGHLANGRTIAMTTQAEAWAAARGVPKQWPLFQGSYHSGTGASGGTHDGGGALDVNTAGKSPRQIRVMVEALRRAGFAAWHRPEPTWADDHLHAIAIGDRDLSSSARSQVREYFAGGDGLVGSAPDPHSAIGRPIPKWAKRFA